MSETPRETEILDAVAKHGTERKAAKALGVAHSTVHAAIVRVRRRQAQRDPKLHSHVAPPGYRLRGVSTLLDSDGEVRQTWVKTAPDGDRSADVLAAFREAVTDLPSVPAVKASKTSDDDLMSVYPMGDPHIGALAWGVETGADFDLKIAERNLVAAVHALVGLSPRSGTALLINLGDYFHVDSNRGETSAGTKLDADSRWGKMLQVGLRAKIACVDACLAKHTRVVVIVNPGNHDTHSSVMLQLCLMQYYRHEPRVTFLHEIPKAYTYFEFGACLIGTTHGNLCKPDALPGIMADDVPEAWGRTKYRHWLLGHFHHVTVREHPGCTVETFRTLAAADAWHASSGYRAGRSMVCDVYSRTRGRVLRHEIGVEALT